MFQGTIVTRFFRKQRIVLENAFHGAYKTLWSRYYRKLKLSFIPAFKLDFAVLENRRFAHSILFSIIHGNRFNPSTIFVTKETFLRIHICKNSIFWKLLYRINKYDNYQI